MGLSVAVNTIADSALAFIGEALPGDTHVEVTGHQDVSVQAISAAKIDALTFAGGAGVAALAGAIVAPLGTVNPNMGLPWLIDSFLVVIVGGESAIGPVVGAVFVRALAAGGSLAVAIPSAGLGLVAVTALLVGVVAGIAPARRAARLEVLDAIHEQ